MIAIVKQVHFERKTAGRKRLAPGPKPTPPPRIPRIAKLMALAIRFQGLVRDGRVRDQSDLSRLAHVTQPRMTQIMNLLHLAPDIQEELLFLPPVESGREIVHERMLRPVAGKMDWGKQRAAWRQISAQRSADNTGAMTTRFPQK